MRLAPDYDALDVANKVSVSVCVHNWGMVCIGEPYDPWHLITQHIWLYSIVGEAEPFALCWVHARVY